MKLAHVRDNVTFEVAFREARAAGADQFRWRRSNYTTDRDDDPKPPNPPVVICIEEIKDGESSE